MKPASAKQKGRKFQQTVRDAIIELLKTYGVVPGDVKSTPMGVSDVDVQLSPFALGLLPISVECKSLARHTIFSTYDQASRHRDGGEPVVFIKVNNRKPLVVVAMNYYLELEQARIENELRN